MLEAKKRLKKALMQQLLTGKKRLSNYSAPWNTVSFSELFKRVTRPIAVENGTSYRLVSIRRRGGGLFDRGVYTSNDIGYSELNTTYIDDFLVSKRQATHGAVTVVTQNFAKTYVSNEYTIFEKRKAVAISMRFFSWFIRRRELWHMTYVSSNGVHIEKLIFDPKHFLKLHISIPPTTNEQDAIASVLESSEAEIATLEIKIAALQKQKKGLMQKLLTGEVRVKI